MNKGRKEAKGRKLLGGKQSLEVVRHKVSGETTEGILKERNCGRAVNSLR